MYSRSPACRGPLGTPRGAGTDPDACHQCSQITQRAGQQDQQISQSTDRQRNGYSKLEAQSQLETQRPEKRKPGSSRDLEMQLPAPLPAHHTHRSRSLPVAAAPAEPQHPPPPLAGSECWWVTRAQPTGRPRGSCVPLSLPGAASPSSPPLAAALPDQRATVPPGQELTELVFIPSAIPRSGRQSARVTHDGGLSWQGRGHPTQFRAIQPRVVGTASLPTGPCGPQHLLRARSLVY